MCYQFFMNFMKYENKYMHHFNTTHKTWGKTVTSLFFWPQIFEWLVIAGYCVAYNVD